MELKKYWRILVRRKVLFFSIFGGIVLVSLFLGFSFTPIYYASSRVLIKNTDPNTTIVSSMPTNAGKINYIETTNALGNMQALIENDTSIGKVIKDLNLSSGGKPYACMEFLNPGLATLLRNKRGVKVKQVSDTEIFEITGYSPDVAEAENISNAVVANFRRLNMKINRKEVNGVVSLLQRETKKIKDTLAFFENAIKDYQVKHEVIAIESKSSEMATQLISLESSLAKMVSEKEMEHPDVAAALRQIAAMRSELLKIPEIQINYNTIKRISDSMVDTYKSLLSDLEKAKILRAMNITNVSVLERAQISPLHKKYNTYFPRKKIMLMLGIMLGSTLGAFVVFVKEYLDDTIKEPEDVRDMLAQPLLGILPGNNQPVFPRSLSPQFTGKVSGTMLGIKHVMNGKPPKFLTITSFGKGEGKTTLSSCLGYLTAESGTKTLLVDFGIDAPKIHNYFEVSSPEIGLIDCIQSGKKPEDALVKLKGDNLFLLSMGKSSPVGISLNSKKLQEFFSGLQAMFDVIIYDTPSFEDGFEYALTAYGLDNVIVIIEANKSSGEQIQRELAFLKGKGINLVGVVLNKYP